MEYIEGSEEIVGYRVKLWEREPFTIVGYTLVVPPGKRGEGMIPRFWSDVISDGRLDRLVGAAAACPWVLGLGSWDEECEKGGQRYTICVEETEQTDTTALSREFDLYRQTMASTTWMCFEVNDDLKHERLWKDNPYKMMPKLGYAFHWDVGVHFDALHPDFHRNPNPSTEFWISVTKA